MARKDDYSGNVESAGGKNRVYPDTTRNARGQAVAAPYSARPQPDATVSAPLKWSEVGKELDRVNFTIQDHAWTCREGRGPMANGPGPGIDLRACLQGLEKACDKSEYVEGLDGDEDTLWLSAVRRAGHPAPGYRRRVKAVPRISQLVSISKTPPAMPWPMRPALARGSPSRIA
jgi:hypothetical protein